MRFTHLLHFVAAGLLSGPALVSAARHSRRGVQCSYETPAKSGDTCESLASDWGISVDKFTKINPGVACPNLEAGKSYCVVGESTPDATATSTTSSRPPSTTLSTSTTKKSPAVTSTGATTTTTSPPDGIQTPQPTQPGMVPNCDRFYFVQAGDTCAAIAQQHGVTVQQFQTWNPSVGSSCAGLWANVYVCVRTVGFQPPATTTTGPPNGIQTPQPTQPGMVTNCNKFHLVEPGSACQAIADQNGITLPDFYKWNPGVGSNCESLWANTYACVGVIGGGTAPPTTTKPPTGVQTPTPTQPGMVSGCDRFYFVQPGDTCAAIASQQGITVQQFQTWNPAVKSDCSNLWANTYACVRGP